MTLPSFCEKVVSAPAPKKAPIPGIAEGRGLLEVEVLQYIVKAFDFFTVGVSVKYFLICTVSFPFLPLFYISSLRR